MHTIKELSIAQGNLSFAVANAFSVVQVDIQKERADKAALAIARTTSWFLASLCKSLPPLGGSLLFLASHWSVLSELHWLVKQPMNNFLS